MVYERIIQLFFHLPSHNNLYCTVQFVFPQEFPACLQLRGGCGLFSQETSPKKCLMETSKDKESRLETSTVKMTDKASRLETSTVKMTDKASRLETSTVKMTDKASLLEKSPCQKISPGNVNGQNYPIYSALHTRKPTPIIKSETFYWDICHCRHAGKTFLGA